MGKKAAKGAKAGLLQSNGALTPEFQTVLREIFGTYDKDCDGALSLEELETFATASKSGEKINDAELKQLGTFFETNSKGWLTLKGFEQMYIMQTQQTASDVWRDLQNLGYKPSLELLGTGPIAQPPKTVDPEELRAALVALKTDAESPAAHRRVGEALKGMGRDEAAARSFKQAEEIELKLGIVAAPSAAPSTVEDLD